MQAIQPPQLRREDRQPTLPAGAPAWITPELFAKTAVVWQRFSPTPLSDRDTLEILLGAGRLVDVLLDFKGD